jgi:hypothetical protein
VAWSEFEMRKHLPDPVEIVGEDPAFRRLQARGLNSPAKNGIRNRGWTTSGQGTCRPRRGGSRAPTRHCLAHIWTIHRVGIVTRTFITIHFGS